MSTYKQIKGVTVQTRDTDPELNVGSWSSGDTMNTPRSQSGSSGTQTSGLVFAGDEYPASPRLSDKNEYYNGSSWTELAEVNTARRLISGAGASHTSAIAFAGYTTTDVTVQKLGMEAHGLRLMKCKLPEQLLEMLEY